jgi:hypothetical protein
MKTASSKPKTRILATKKPASPIKKGEPLVFVALSKEEILATRNPAYKYLIK